MNEKIEELEEVRLEVEWDKDGNMEAPQTLTSFLHAMNKE